MEFEELDYYLINEELSEEERLVRDTIRNFVEDQYLPIVEDHYRAGTFPMEIVPQLAELGTFGANLEGYGCAGLNNVAYGLIMQELERGDSGLRSFVSVQSALCMYPISAFGSEEQKEKWLPPMAKGEKLACFGLTEPDFGSNPAGLRTRAKKVGDGYVINGTKAWITNGSVSDIAVVWARTDEDSIQGFLVEKDREGFTAREMRRKFSLRASDTSELIFDECHIPAENHLPGATGLKHALMCLTQARFGIAWGAIGAAQTCFSTALNYAKTRIQFDGKPIASHQLTQQKLADMATEITKAQLLCLRLGRLKDQGKANHVQISIAKRNNVEKALEIARLSRGILGASGITDEYPVGRHMCNLETVYTYEGTHEIHTLLIGEDLTGIPAYV